MQALITTPGTPGSTRTATIAEPGGDAGLRVRTLEIGVCGTDREITAGEFGEAPPGERDLVLGHEFVGRVERDGHGFARGDLVTATVRRSCGRCAACHSGSPDACSTGAYRERGITALHGFASDVVVEGPEHLVPIPPSLGRIAVLAEPSSVCERAIRHALAIGERQVWQPQRALVIGAGAIGMLTTYLMRLRGLEVWTAARSPRHSEKARLASASGARYVATGGEPLERLRDDVGGFDLVVEAAGSAEVMLAAPALLRRNGVACLLGLDAHRRPLGVDSGAFAVDMVIENRVLFGSVNAHRRDWEAAVADLRAMRERWPDALDAMVGARVAPDAFADAFAYRGVKATLRFA